MTLVPGQPAPDFRLPRGGGGAVSLADLRGRMAVLFFYPRDLTPSRTAEAQGLTALPRRFAAAGAAVLGVSGGTAAAQERFAAEAGLSAPLLADAGGGMLRAYGAWGEKALYGRRFMGIRRSTVLLDPQGRVLRLWRVARIRGHPEEVLAEVGQAAAPA